jgi:L-lactate dehydrogenase complex protein LldE
MVRHYHPTVARRAEDRGRVPGLADRVAETGPRVYDLCEFLIDVLEVTDVGASFHQKVTASAHPRHRRATQTFA